MTGGGYHRPQTAMSPGERRADGPRAPRGIHRRAVAELGDCPRRSPCLMSADGLALIRALRTVELPAARFARCCPGGGRKTVLKARRSRGFAASFFRSPSGGRRTDGARSRKSRTLAPRHHLRFVQLPADRARSLPGRARSLPAGIPGPRRQAKCCECPARPVCQPLDNRVVAGQGLRPAAAETEGTAAGLRPRVRRIGSPARLPALPPRQGRASSRPPMQRGVGPSSEMTRRTSRPGNCPARPAVPRHARIPRKRYGCQVRLPPARRERAFPHRDQGPQPLRTGMPAAGRPYPVRNRRPAVFPDHRGSSCGR
jgi:hypothetical protein